MNPRPGEFSSFIQSELDIYLHKQNSETGGKKKKSKAKLAEPAADTCVSKLLELEKDQRNDSFRLYQCFADNPPSSKDPQYPIYLAVLFVISNKPDIEIRSHNKAEFAKLEQLGAALFEFTRQKLDPEFFPYIIKHKQPSAVVNAFILLQANKLMSPDIIDAVSAHVNPLEAARALNAIRHLPERKDIQAIILQKIEPFAAVDAFKLLLDKNPDLTVAAMKPILIHENPVAAAHAYINLYDAKLDGVFIKDFMNDALQTPYPDTASQGLIILHKLECDSQINKDAFLSACDKADNAGAVIAALKNKEGIEAVLQHPQHDNLMEILSLLQKSNILKPVNIEILMQKDNAALLSDKLLKQVWLWQKLPITQDKFNQILANMKKTEAHKQTPRPVAGEIKLGFMRKEASRSKTDTTPRKDNEYRKK